MTATPQTPPGAALDPRPAVAPGGLNGRACTLPVPAPRDGVRPAGTPAGTVVAAAPVPAGHRKCQTPGCVAGMIRMSYILDRGGPVHTLLVDDPACDATGLDLASYAAGGADERTHVSVPLAHHAGGAS